MAIKNLAFKGGGVLGIAYAGAITVLEQQGILAGIEKVAGTSAGAITAAMVSLNYSAAEIRTIVNGTSFKSFEDRKDPFRIPITYGLYAGDALLSFIQNQITAKGLPATATFRDFNTNNYKDLHVFATDLNIQDCQEFSFATTPDVVVAEAIRASMSIPIFFKAWQFSNSVPSNHIYVDGGVIYNYPLTAFDTSTGANEETLGFYLTDMQDADKDNGLQTGQIEDYIKVLFDTLMDAQVIDFDKDPEMQDRTIKIDDLGISSTNFDLTTDQEEALYQSGIKYTTAHFAGNAS